MRVCLKLFAIALLLIQPGCMDSKVSVSKQKSAFANAKYKPCHHYKTVSGRTFHYVSTGSSKNHCLLIIHGSPGGWFDYNKYLADTQLTAKYYVIAVDRPGFGESGNGVAMPSLQKQAEVIHSVIDSLNYNQKPIIIMGHSYGGPLAIKFSMLYPTEISHIVLLAAAINPDLERAEWYRPILKTRFFQWLLPGAINASNLEIMQLKPDLMEMLLGWREISNPVTMVHGTSDMLVPYKNTNFAQNQLARPGQLKVISLQNVNHFIPWTHYALVKSILLDSLSR